MEKPWENKFEKMLRKNTRKKYGKSSENLQKKRGKKLNNLRKICGKNSNNLRIVEKR